MTTTPLDAAHAAMEAAPDDDAARLAFYERLSDAELFVLLEEEAAGETIRPRVFPVAGAEVVLAFDLEGRLADFVGAAPYAAMTGRTLANLLTGQALGLGLNLGVAPSAFLMPSDAVDWLAETLGGEAEQVEARPEEIRAPAGLPEALLTVLDGKLARASGLARMAYLVGVTYRDGARGHMLAFIDPLAGAEAALARAASEALTFSGIEAGALDVAFFRASDPIAARLARVGLRFDLPAPADPAAPRAAPGSDPEKPPRLR